MKKHLTYLLLIISIFLINFNYVLAENPNARNNGGYTNKGGSDVSGWLYSRGDKVDGIFIKVYFVWSHGEDDSKIPSVIKKYGNDLEKDTPLTDQDNRTKCMYIVPEGLEQNYIDILNGKKTSTNNKTNGYEGCTVMQYKNGKIHFDKTITGSKGVDFTIGNNGQWINYTNGKWTFNANAFKCDTVGDCSNKTNSEESRKKEFKNWLKLFGLNEKTDFPELEYSCSIKAGGDKNACIKKGGYRLKAQLYLTESIGQKVTKSKEEHKIVSLKEHAKNFYSNDFAGSLATAMNLDYSETHYHDKNIFDDYANYENKEEAKKNCLINESCSASIWLVDISKLVDNQNNYDTSIDSACINCEDSSEKSDHISYLVQDTYNWKAITGWKNNSSKDKKTETSKYYTHTINNKEYVCRETYKIKFPRFPITSDNKLTGAFFTVAQGRFIAVNDDYTKGYYEVNVTNFAPISVSRHVECLPAKKDNEIIDQDVINIKNKLDNKNQNTKVKLAYRESNLPRYTYTDDLDIKNNEIKCQKEDLYNIGYEDDTSLLVKQGISCDINTNYQLKNDVFRFSRIVDGKSVKDTNNLSKDRIGYLDLGIPNLPVSFNINDVTTQTNEQNSAGKVALKFTLPTWDDHNIQTAWENGLTYFYKNKKIKNIYTKNPNNLDVFETIDYQNNACDSFFADPTNNEKCKENKINNINKGNTCIALNNNIDNLEPGKDDTNRGYMCSFEFSDKCDTKEEADAYGIDFDTENKRCYHKENITADDCLRQELVYDENTKTCVSKLEEKNCQSRRDADRLNRDWNEKEGICCPVGSYYDNHTEKCLTDSDKTFNNLNLMYRTIDTNNPFPGSTGNGRKTMSNWCYTPVSEKTICDGNSGIDNKSSSNKVVEYQIKEANSSSESTDNENYVMHVFLDNKALKKVKDYNKNQKSQGGYSDSTLKCSKENLRKQGYQTTNGFECKSKMLHDRNTKNNIAQNVTMGKITATEDRHR